MTDFIETSWDPIVRQRVVQYIKERVGHMASPDGGFHNYLLRSKEIDAKAVILIDSGYIWLFCFLHYVAFHHIKLPDHF